MKWANFFNKKLCFGIAFAIPIFGIFGMLVPVFLHTLTMGAIGLSTDEFNILLKDMDLAVINAVLAWSALIAFVFMIIGLVNDDD